MSAWGDRQRHKWATRILGWLMRWASREVQMACPRCALCQMLLPLSAVRVHTGEYLCPNCKASRAA